MLDIVNELIGYSLVLLYPFAARNPCTWDASVGSFEITAMSKKVVSAGYLTGIDILFHFISLGTGPEVSYPRWPGSLEINERCNHNCCVVQPFSRVVRLEALLIFYPMVRHGSLLDSVFLTFLESLHSSAMSSKTTIGQADWGVSIESRTTIEGRSSFSGFHLFLLFSPFHVFNNLFLRHLGRL